MGDDYRNTKYCLENDDISRKKDEVVNLVKNDHPRAVDMHSYISQNEKPYKLKFIEAYNGKCAYCGVSHSIVPKSHFEVDHFIPKKEFPTKSKAGYIENLVLACHDCNHKKSSFVVDKDYYHILNPDMDIDKCFVRDELYYIKVSDKFVSDEIVNLFYNQLNLDGELHRIDYLLMSILGLCEKNSANSNIYNKLRPIAQILQDKRNLYV